MPPGGPTRDLGPAIELRSFTGLDAVRADLLDVYAEVRAPPPSGGHGLIGLRERVRLAGGGIETGPRPGGGSLVAAELPAPAPAETAAGPASGSAADTGTRTEAGTETGT
ncbi:hypothetical protein [Streptomyces sp. ODS28]|uniref:hypothetical protein n=1 Tax=Streptomyces sp. ODS28 TaxID=3136688 RepID=UPI0031EC90C4